MNSKPHRDPPPSTQDLVYWHKWRNWIGKGFALVLWWPKLGTQEVNSWYLAKASSRLGEAHHVSISYFIPWLLVIMIWISWNIRGLNAKIKPSSLHKLILSHDPHFIFIQETKMEDFQPKIIKSLWNMGKLEWLFSPSVGTSGSILTIWRINFFTLESYRMELNWIAI